MSVILDTPSLYLEYPHIAASLTEEGVSLALVEQVFMAKALDGVDAKPAAIYAYRTCRSGTAVYAPTPEELGFLEALFRIFVHFWDDWMNRKMPETVLYSTRVGYHGEGLAFKVTYYEVLRYDVPDHH